LDTPLYLVLRARNIKVKWKEANEICFTAPTSRGDV